MKKISKKGNVLIGSGGAIFIFIIAYLLFIYPTQERLEAHIGVKLNSGGNPNIDYLNVQTIKIPVIQLFEKKGNEGQYALRVEAHWIFPTFEPISFSEERINVGLGDHSFVIQKKPPVEKGNWLVRAEIYEFINSKWTKINEKEIDFNLESNEGNK